MIEFVSRGGFFTHGLVTVMLLAGIFGGALGQNRDIRVPMLNPQNRVDEGLFVKIGGIEQWVQISGESQANPVILILHGGPGFSYIPFTETFRSWEKYFTVVQWDQRGAGKTYNKNGKTGSKEMTINRMVEDGIEVAEFVRQHLKKKKIILLAHSWGTVLGLPMIVRRPDLFYAYVGTGQVVNMMRNEAASYDLALARARATGNEQAIKALERIGKPPYQNYATWMIKGRVVVMIAPPSASGRSLPNVFSADLIAGYTFSSETLYDELMKYDATSLGGKFKIPILLLQGDTDLQSPAPLVKEYLSIIKAPDKEMVLLKGEGHTAVLTLPDVFLKELITRIRPLAK